MAYSGRYKVKSRSKYKGNPDNVVFRSLWERNAFKWCDDTKEVKHWVSEEVVIPYLWEVDNPLLLMGRRQNGILMKV